MLDYYSFLPTFASIIICRLSLKYHPDKNKDKGSQAKFAEINNGNANNFFSPLFTYFFHTSSDPVISYSLGDNMLESLWFFISSDVECV